MGPNITRLIVKSIGIECGFCADTLYMLAFDSEIILNGNNLLFVKYFMTSK